MSNLFLKPFLEGAKKAFFPYTREKLCEKPMFPTYTWDGGASFFTLDRFGTLNSDQLIDKIMDGSLFEYWTRDGGFDWNSVYKDFGPINYTCEWEGHIWLARLYIILIVAQKFCRTKDERYAQAWLKIVKAWYAANPYTRYEDRPSDLVWRDMQVTWRAINLVHSMFLLGENKSFTAEDWHFLYDLVKVHAVHMYGEGVNHAKDPAPDNHKLQIGTALIMFATMFPEFFDSKAYIATASKIVSDNMENSIFADGCNNEDSMSYSHFIARLYLEAELFLKNNGYPTIPGCSETIQHQYGFLYHFASPTGKTLQIGDSYVMDAWADIDFIDSFYPLSFPREKKTYIFEPSRMAHLKNDRYDVYVDAMDMTEWHQHYGRPNVLIFAGAQSLVVDSGSINYDRGGLRTHLNSAEGHNVIVCEEIPLDDHLTRTKTKENLAFESFEEKDGCQRLVVSNNVVSPDGRSYYWTRAISLYDDRVEIHDSVSASMAMHFVSRFHLPDTRTGYYWTDPKYQPISDDRKTASLRFGSMMETVETDAPFEVQYAPCVDITNRMNYTGILVRKHFAKKFEEKTVLRFDRIR